MCMCTTSVIVLSSRVEFSAVAVAVFAVASEESEDEQSGDFVSWRFTTLTKLSIDVSGLSGHKQVERPSIGFSSFKLSV